MEIVKAVATLALCLVANTCAAHCWSMAGTYGSGTNWASESAEVRLTVRQSGCTITIEDSSGTISGTYETDNQTAESAHEFCGAAVPASADPANYSHFTLKNTHWNASAFSSECRGTPSADTKDIGGYLRRIGVRQSNT